MKYIRTDKEGIINKKIKGINLLKVLAIMFMTGVSMQFVASYVLTTVLNFMPDVAEEYSNNISAITDFSIEIFIIVVLLSPVLEELIFRGLICGLLSRVVSFLAANIIQALLFAVYHGNVVQGVYAFVLGLFIGYLLMLTGNILCTMAFHTGINLCGMFIDKIIPKSANEIVSVFAAVIAAVLVLLGIKLSKHVMEKTKETDNNNIL